MPPAPPPSPARCSVCRCCCRRGARARRPRARAGTVPSGRGAESPSVGKSVALAWYSGRATRCSGAAGCRAPSAAHSASNCACKARANSSSSCVGHTRTYITQWTEQPRDAANVMHGSLLAEEGRQGGKEAGRHGCRETYGQRTIAVRRNPSGRQHDRGSRDWHGNVRHQHWSTCERGSVVGMYSVRSADVERLGSEGWPHQHHAPLSSGIGEWAAQCTAEGSRSAKVLGSL